MSLVNVVFYKLLFIFSLRKFDFRCILNGITDWFWLNMNFAFEHCFGGIVEDLFPCQGEEAVWCAFCAWIIFLSFLWQRNKSSRWILRTWECSPDISIFLATENQLLLISEPKQIILLLLRVGHRLLYVLRIYSEIMQFEILFNRHYSKPNVFAKHSVLMFVNHTVSVSSGDYDWDEWNSQQILKACQYQS